MSVFNYNPKMCTNEGQKEIYETQIMLIESYLEIADDYVIEQVKNLGIVNKKEKKQEL